MTAVSQPFLLIFRESTPEVYDQMSVSQRTESLDRWNAWFDGLVARGKVDHGHPLEATGRVVTGSRGERIFDGPFAETKEAIGGYFLLQVADLEEATRIAQECPSLAYGMEIEIRPVAKGCHLAKSIGRTGMKS